MKKCDETLFVCLVWLFCLVLSSCRNDGEPCGLLVVNDSRESVYAVSVDWEDRTTGVTDARGRALLERGDTLGLALEEGETGRFTVTLSGQWGQTLGRASASYRGRPIWLTLEEDGTVSVREEKTDGMDAG